MKVIKVHGWNVKDGWNQVDAAINPWLETYGYDFVDYDYGWRWLFRMRDWFGYDTNGLLENADAGDIAVGHSNGCTLIHRAAQWGAKFEKVIYLNPALDTNTPLPPQIKEAHVWYTPDDLATKFSEILRFHQWGSMGARGYLGHDDRYINHNYYEVFDRTFVKIRHSTVFQYFDMFGPYFMECLRGDHT